MKRKTRLKALPIRTGPIPLRAWSVVLGAYLLATAITNAAFMADTHDYVTSILTGVEFWEFGHLWWRPLGWLLFHAVAPFTGLLAGLDARAQATLVLLALNWLAGLAAALLLCDLIRRVTGKAWAAGFAATAFVASHAVLNYAQSGAPYIPGLTLLLLGLWVLARDGRNPAHSWRTALFAGAALAGSVCMWLIYLGALPGALAAPLFFFGSERPYRRLVMRTALVLILATTLAYGAALALAGLTTPHAVRSWIAAAAGGEHMRVGLRGAPRAVLGLPRALLYLGDDGVLYKRFLLHDPLNPVSLHELLRHSLVKIMAVYGMLGWLIGVQWRAPRGRRLLGFLALSAAPAVGFAALCDGGAYERYLPFFPALFLSLAAALAEGTHWRVPLATAEAAPTSPSATPGPRPRLRAAAALARAARRPPAIACGLVAAIALNNGSALAVPVLRARQERIASRITALLPLLRRESVLVTVNPQDELAGLSRDFPFAACNAHSLLHVAPALFPGTYQVPNWRRSFARQVQSVWERGGDVWLSCRVLCPRPLPQWHWVEGDDERLCWTDVRAFFSHLERDMASGGEDGFMRLSRSGVNQAYLARFASPLPQAGRLAAAATRGQG